MSIVEQTTRPPGIDGATQAPVKVSVVIPCLNEEASIARCVTEARKAIEGQGWEGEVIVADNGSDDRSAELARGAATGAHTARASRPPRATTS